ncbi:MAG: hypothetical protein IT423_07170 [Pirellulaceae bacterium]|nr:hypothetical protein [Pirellulaceae bacterium]
MRVSIRSIALITTTVALPIGLWVTLRAGTFGLMQLLTVFVFIPLSIILVFASLSFDIWSTARAARSGAWMGTIGAVAWFVFLLCLPVSDDPYSAINFQATGAQFTDVQDLQPNWQCWIIW